MQLFPFINPATLCLAVALIVQSLYFKGRSVEVSGSKSTSAATGGLSSPI